ncbi:hydroxypyruvate isomerase family protein [Microbacterium tumbae]
MTYELCANLSILLPDRPLHERFRAAADLGFRAVELWWPFPDAVPPAGEVDAMVAALDAADVRLVGLNLFAGDMAAGDRGIASHPGREDEFRANVETVVGIAERTGCTRFNALYGAPVDVSGEPEQERTALRNLVFAVQALDAVGGTVLIEPLSGVPGFPLRTAADGAGVLDAVVAEAGYGRAGLLFDTFHLSNNGDDLHEVLAEHGPRIAHVQFADAPGRGEPGTGDVDFGQVLDDLVACGYEGFVSCEYRPTRPLGQTLEWTAAHPQLARLG